MTADTLTIPYHFRCIKGEYAVFNRQNEGKVWLVSCEIAVPIYYHVSNQLKCMHVRSHPVMYRDRPEAGPQWSHQRDVGTMESWKVHKVMSVYSGQAFIG